MPGLECVLTAGHGQVEPAWSQETAFLIPHIPMIVLNQSPWMGSLDFCETGWESDGNFPLQLLTEANIPFTQADWQCALAAFAVPMAGTESRSHRHLHSVCRRRLTPRTTVCLPHNCNTAATITPQAGSGHIVCLSTGIIGQ